MRSAVQNPPCEGAMVQHLDTETCAQSRRDAASDVVGQPVRRDDDDDAAQPVRLLRLANAREHLRLENRGVRMDVHLHGRESAPRAAGGSMAGLAETPLALDGVGLLTSGGQKEKLGGETV